MKRIGFFLILISAALLSFAEGDGGGLSPAQIQAMESHLSSIEDPAARLFFQAGIERAKGNPEQALRQLSQLIVLYPHQEQWLPKSELLCAELYLEMGMLDAADVTARQVQFLNKGTDAAEKARLFREKVKQVKEQSEESE